MYNFWRTYHENSDVFQYKTKSFAARELRIDLNPSPAFSYVLKGLEIKSTGPESCYCTR